MSERMLPCGASIVLDQSELNGDGQRVVGKYHIVCSACHLKRKSNGRTKETLDPEGACREDAPKLFLLKHCTTTTRKSPFLPWNRRNGNGPIASDLVCEGGRAVNPDILNQPFPVSLTEK